MRPRYAERIGRHAAMNGRSTYALELLTIAIPSESSRWLNYGFKAVVCSGLISSDRSIGGQSGIDEEKS
jgi:hypothetical protein